MNDSVAGSGDSGGLGGPSGLPLPAAGGAEPVLSFVLPTFPPSVNRLHKIDHNRRLVTLSDEALLWKTRIVPFIKPCHWPGDWLLKLILVYESDKWICKNGNLRRKDSHNLDKITVDALFAKWGWDDSRLVELVSQKRYGPREQIRVTLERAELTLMEVR